MTPHFKFFLALTLALLCAFAATRVHACAEADEDPAIDWPIQCSNTET